MNKRKHLQRKFVSINVFEDREVKEPSLHCCAGKNNDKQIHKQDLCYHLAL